MIVPKGTQRCVIEYADDGDPQFGVNSIKSVTVDGKPVERHTDVSMLFGVKHYWIVSPGVYIEEIPDEVEG